MRIAIFSSVFGVAAALAFAACSSSSGGGGAADASVDDATADAPRDTGPDRVIADAGQDAREAAPGVGVVACGASDCTLPSQVCCPRVGDGGACFPKDAAPCDQPLACDQPGDCASGTTCCYAFTTACGDVGSSCQPSCGAAEVGACQGLPDCQVCVALTCAGLPLKTCGTDGVCCR